MNGPILQGGKLDLTEVEGIADLLAAETAAQHRQVRSPAATSESGSLCSDRSLPSKPLSPNLILEMCLPLA